MLYDINIILSFYYDNILSDVYIGRTACSIHGTRVSRECVGQYVHFYTCSILYTYAQSQLHRLWQCVMEEKNETIRLKELIETNERTLALERAIDVQVNTSSLHYLKKSALFVFIEIASSSWSCKQ